MHQFDFVANRQCTQEEEEKGKRRREQETAVLYRKLKINTEALCFYFTAFGDKHYTNH